MQLQDFKDERKAKIKAAYENLGRPTNDFKCDKSNRDTIRSVLSGMGFPYSAYKDTTVSELEDAWKSLFLHGSFDPEGLGLVPLFVKAGVTSADDISNEIERCIDRLDIALDWDIDTASYPSVSDIIEVMAAYRDGGAQTPKDGEAPSDAALELAKALSAVMENMGPKPAELDESRVVELIRAHSSATEIRLVTSDETRTIPTGLHHKVLPDVIKMLSAGVNVMMVGPAGSGKTTIAHQAAQALDLPFYFNGALNSEYKLTGFVDAQGRIVSTAFRKAYETGGVYLFDEIDASMPDALLAFNAALSNGQADFPDGTIPKHDKFHCVAAANTFGRGADRVYVGRNQLDGASLDRFCVINVDYDEDLERALSANDNWTGYVQKVRKAVFDLKIRHVVSPRASISGSRMLAAGLPQEFVEEAALFKGMDRDSLSKIKAAAGV
ncbi:AAA family ATPase [Methylobacterium oryzae]|uniref:AAA family ATPase n=1 Tax=Methylobacterium oryzae TaxID=334852 RepID=UPI002F2D3DB0